MSLRPDGSYQCDRCGQTAGNGGVVDAATVVDLEFRGDGSAVPRNFHLCRVNGCASIVLAPPNLPAYFSSRKDF